MWYLAIGLHIIEKKYVHIYICMFIFLSTYIYISLKRIRYHSKLIVYKAILKLIWIFDMRLWGTASNRNIEILEYFQTKTFRTIFNIPQYVSNICYDLKLPTVKQVIMMYSNNYQKTLSNYINELAF